MRKIKCFHFDLGAGWTSVARLSPSGDLPNQVRANGEKSRLQLTRRSHVHWLTGPAKCWVHPNHRFEQSSEKKMQQTDRLVEISSAMQPNAIFLGSAIIASCDCHHPCKALAWCEENHV